MIQLMQINKSIEESKQTAHFQVRIAVFITLLQHKPQSAGINTLPHKEQMPEAKQSSTDRQIGKVRGK